MADVDPSASEPRDEEMDVEIDEAIIKEEATQPSSLGLDGTNEEPPAMSTGEPTLEQQAQEARIPAKKDANLREFLGKMDDYAPIVRLLPTTSSVSMEESRN
jgi:transcription initiation factor TFIID subunit 10